MNVISAQRSPGSIHKSRHQFHPTIDFYSAENLLHVSYPSREWMTWVLQIDLISDKALVFYGLRDGSGGFVNGTVTSMGVISFRSGTLSGLDRLTFANFAAVSPTAWALLDNIHVEVVQAVPEPACVSLVTLGTIAVLLRSRGPRRLQGDARRAG